MVSGIDRSAVEAFLADVRHESEPHKFMAGLVTVIDDHEAVFSEFCQTMAVTQEECEQLLVLMGFHLEAMREKAGQGQPSETTSGAGR